MMRTGTSFLIEERNTRFYALYRQNYAEKNDIYVLPKQVQDKLDKLNKD